MIHERSRPDPPNEGEGCPDGRVHNQTPSHGAYNDISVVEGRLERPHGHSLARYLLYCRLPIQALVPPDIFEPRRMEHHRGFRRMCLMAIWGLTTHTHAQYIYIQ